MFDYNAANNNIKEYNYEINKLHYKASQLKNLYGINYKNNPLYNHKLWLIHYEIAKYKNLIKNIEYVRYLEQKQDKIYKERVHPIANLLLLDSKYSLPPDIINMIVKNII
jgi:hypothetical protein